MRAPTRCLLLALIATLGAAAMIAQTGTIEVATRIQGLDGKPRTDLSRKRFYLLSGGLAQNAALLDKLKTAEIKSRDCYYTDAKASPQFICWLKAQNCESPYCRKIKTEDVAQVPEFKAAYDTSLKRPGMTQAFALDWLTTSLPPIFSNGFYEDRRKLADVLLAGFKPMQSAMSDTAGVRAWLTDIPLTLSGDKKTQLFTVSNIVPIELGSKSYVWACEKEAGSTKVKLLLPAKESSTCKLFVRELKTCQVAACPAK